METTVQRAPEKLRNLAQFLVNSKLLIQFNGIALAKDLATLANEIEESMTVAVFDKPGRTLSVKWNDKWYRLAEIVKEVCFCCGEPATDTDGGVRALALGAELVCDDCYQKIAAQECAECGRERDLPPKWRPPHIGRYMGKPGRLCDDCFRDRTLGKTGETIPYSGENKEPIA